MGCATPLRRLVAGLSSRRPWSYPGPVHLNAVVEQGTRQVSVRVLRFPQSVLFHHCHILMMLLPDGQTDKVWDSSNSNGLVGILEHWAEMYSTFAFISLQIVNAI